MTKRGPSRMPANALIAFESAARHGNFTLAARELRTSQAAMSRQIGKLETWLSVRLFERSRAGVTLTAAGARFRDGVAAGLAAIQRGAAEAAELATAEQVVIACSHEASHFFLIPRYDALRAGGSWAKTSGSASSPITTTSKTCRSTRRPTS